jgi:hypothetical protein
MKRWQVYAKKSIISMLSDFCEVQEFAGRESEAAIRR